MSSVEEHDVIDEEVIENGEVKSAKNNFAKKMGNALRRSKRMMSGKKRPSFRAGSKENIEKATSIQDVRSEESAELSTSLDQTDSINSDTTNSPRRKISQTYYSGEKQVVVDGKTIKEVEVTGEKSPEPADMKKQKKLTKKKSIDPNELQVSCRDLGKADHEGWLLKKAGGHGLVPVSWKRYWCVIKNGQLYCFKTSFDAAADYCFPLKCYELEIAVEKRKNSAFKLSPNEEGRKPSVFSDSEEEIKKWMEIIKNVQTGVDVSQHDDNVPDYEDRKRVYSSASKAKEDSKRRPTSSAFQKNTETTGMPAGFGTRTSSISQPRVRKISAGAAKPESCLAVGSMFKSLQNTDDPGTPTKENVNLKDLLYKEVEVTPSGTPEVERLKQIEMEKLNAEIAKLNNDMVVLDKNGERKPNVILPTESPSESAKDISLSEPVGENKKPILEETVETAATEVKTDVKRTSELLNNLETSPKATLETDFNKPVEDKAEVPDLHLDPEKVKESLPKEVEQHTSVSVTVEVEKQNDMEAPENRLQPPAATESTPIREVNKEVEKPKETEVSSSSVEVPEIENETSTFPEKQQCEMAAEVEKQQIETQIQKQKSSNEAPTKTEEPLSKTSIEIEKPLNETPSEIEKQLNEATTKTEKPLNETPVETEKPLNETPAETEKTLNETPVETEKTLNGTPAETVKPLNETPAETVKPPNETPVETEKPLNEIPAETGKTLNETPAETENVATSSESNPQTETQDLKVDITPNIKDDDATTLPQESAETDTVVNENIVQEVKSAIKTENRAVESLGDNKAAPENETLQKNIESQEKDVPLAIAKTSGEEKEKIVNDEETGLVKEKQSDTIIEASVEVKSADVLNDNVEAKVILDTETNETAACADGDKDEKPNVSVIVVNKDSEEIPPNKETNVNHVNESEPESTEAETVTGKMKETETANAIKDNNLIDNTDHEVNETNEGSSVLDSEKPILLSAPNTDEKRTSVDLGEDLDVPSFDDINVSLSDEIDLELKLSNSPTQKEPPVQQNGSISHIAEV